MLDPGRASSASGRRPTDESWFQVPAGVLVLVALVLFGIRYADWVTTNFVVTSDRIIYRSGVLSKRGIEIPLDRINTVVFHQGPFERILGAGDLEIESAGQTAGPVHRHPQAVDRAGRDLQQSEANENRKFDRVGATSRASVAAGLSVAEQLEKLEGLRDRGSITQEQYEAQKAKLLGGSQAVVTRAPGRRADGPALGRARRAR